jgi:hypothetical protein
MTTNDVGKQGGVGVGLEGLHVGKFIVGDEGAGTSELRGIDVHTYDLS